MDKAPGAAGTENHRAQVLEIDLLGNLDRVDPQVGGDTVAGVSPDVGEGSEGPGWGGNHESVAHSAQDLRLTPGVLVTAQVTDVERKTTY